MPTPYPVIKGPKVIIDYQVGGGTFVVPPDAGYVNSITYLLYVLGGGNQKRIQNFTYDNSDCTSFRSVTEKINGTNSQQMWKENGNSSGYRIVEEKINNANIQSFTNENGNSTGIRSHTETINLTGLQSFTSSNADDTSMRRTTEMVNCSGQQSAASSPVKSKILDLQDYISQSPVVAPEMDTNEDGGNGLKIGQSVLITNT